MKLSAQPPTSSAFTSSGTFEGISELKKAVIDELISLQKHSNTVPVTEIQYVWENTPPSSRLRMLFVDFVCGASKLDSEHAFHENWLPYYTKDFLVDLVIAIDGRSERVSPLPIYWGIPCCYHEH